MPDILVRECYIAPMRIVDFHAHFFSRVFFDTLTDLSPQPGDRETKLAPILAKTGIELPALDVAEHALRWVSELDAKGVEHMVSFASLPEEVPALSEAARAAAGRITPMALVHPMLPGAAGRVETLINDHGFRGVLTFPAMHHYRIGDEGARELLEVLSEHEAIVYVHCGMLVVKLRDLLGLARPYDMRFANPLDILPAANAFPRVTFVVPHFGAGFLRETLMLGAQADNVCVDTSSTNGWIRTQPTRTSLGEVFERALGAFGHERILFGTDSGTFPAGWRRDRFEEQQALLEDLGIAAVEQQQIFAGNAKRLLRLPATGTVTTG
ncbi:MAG: putative TIM-barrel fold metal-dependent hydrolase [Chlamydiales bacterium]|jgi:predicted TIM-barrel fold metal-dependent hydrolase